MSMGKQQKMDGLSVWGLALTSETQVKLLAFSWPDLALVAAGIWEVNWDGRGVCVYLPLLNSMFQTNKQT